MKKTLLFFLNLYQQTSVFRTPRCRFLPTCSEYAREAIEIHGSFKGSYLALKRLLKCHPFGSYGIDPVPEKKYVSYHR